MSVFDFIELDLIFKRYVRPLIEDCVGANNCLRSLLYTIEPGKNRFRSGLAYMLSGKTEQGLIIGAASEIAWSAILILDDIGDNTDVRRGEPSAWHKFGLLEATHAASLGFIIAKDLLKKKIDCRLAESLGESIRHTLFAQIEQNLFDLSISTQNVLDNYFNKTALGRWAIEAGAEANEKLNVSEKDSIKRFSQELAIAAQIRNDLDDFLVDVRRELYEPALKDLADKTLTYVSVSFFELASIEDKARFLSKFWGQKTLQKDKVMQVIYEAFIAYDVFNRCEKEINKRIESAIKLIQELPQSYKDLLVDWAKSYKKERR